MSLQLPTQREQDIAEAAIGDRDVDVSHFVLAIDGEDVAADILEGEWGQDDSGATSLDFTLGVVLPRRLEEAPVEYWIDINGVRVPLLLGPLSAFEVGEDRVTTDPFWAATPAALLPRWTLDEVVEYEGLPPEQIALDALLRIPYPRGGVRVAALGEPILYFTKALGNNFKQDQHVNDIIEALKEQTTYVFRDNARGEHIANPGVEIGSGGTPSRIYNSSDMSGWKTPGRVEHRYNRVVVFRTNPDGTDAYRQAAPIPYRGQRPAFKHHTFYVSLDETGSEAAQRARQLAYDLSTKFSRGVYGGETPLPEWDPFVERQDLFGVNEQHHDLDGSWDRFWLCWVETFKHTRARVGGSESASENALQTVVRYQGTLLEEDLIVVPTLMLSTVRDGVIKTKIAPAPIGAFTHWGQTDYRFDELTSQTYGELP